MEGVKLKLREVILLFATLTATVDGRVAGKVGYTTNYHSGRSYTGINEEIFWVSIGMATAIAVLITIALCYIVYEKCKKRREYYVNV